MTAHLRRALLPVAIGATLAALSTSPVLAHALLVHSSPAANARLDTPPRFVEMRFSEALEPAFSTAQVLDSTGTRVDNRDANVDPSDPTRMTLTLRPLGEGVFTVNWKAASSVDGHVTSGLFSFVVGAAGLAPPPEAPISASAVLPAEVIARWAGYLAAALAFGGVLFLLAVWDPVIGPSSSRELAPWKTLDRAAAALLLAAVTATLVSQATQSAGGHLASAWDPALGGVLFEARFGLLWSARLALAMGLAATMWAGSGRRVRYVRLALGAALLLALSLGSHAATESKPLFPVLADWLHLLGASAWVGGLVYFFAGLASIRSWPSSDRSGIVAAVLPRFSTLAATAVAALLLSGIYGGLQRVGALPALVTTPYGRTLLVKVFLAAVMLCLGAFNLLLATPRVRREASHGEGPHDEVPPFRRRVGVEAALGVAALLAAGLLTSLPPARAAPPLASLTEEARVDDLQIRLSISPGKVGVNTFVVTVTSRGAPVEFISEVELQFTPAQGSLPAQSVVLAEEAPGIYRAVGPYLSLADRWLVRVAVRREGLFDSFADVGVDLRAPGLGRGVASTRLTGAFLLAAAFGAAALAWKFARGRRWLVGATAAVGAVALAAAGLSIASRPMPLRNLPNPVAPNEASIASGRALYIEECLPCHGPTGKGDGPLGLTLNPRPADLTLHTIPGVHPDGQLFAWISDGYPGSVMPAWKGRLSETLRWNLVNYLRTLAPNPAP